MWHIQQTVENKSSSVVNLKWCHCHHKLKTFNLHTQRASQSRHITKTFKPQRNVQDSAAPQEAQPTKIFCSAHCLYSTSNSGHVFLVWFLLRNGPEGRTLPPEWLSLVVGTHIPRKVSFPASPVWMKVGHLPLRLLLCAITVHVSVLGIKLPEPALPFKDNWTKLWWCSSYNQDTLLIPILIIRRTPSQFIKLF